MRSFLLRFATAILVTGAIGVSNAQMVPPTVFDGAPAANWISHPETDGDEFGVFHFRRAFDLESVPAEFTVHVSADNRYRLFLNGTQISSGPQRSDLMHWRYETIDLAPYLEPGRNQLAALVWNWGAARPVAQFSQGTGFLLQGQSPDEALVNSGPDWKVFRNEGYAPLPVRGADVGGYYASPPGEAIDGSRYPWNWTAIDYDDQAWPAARVSGGFGAGSTQLRGVNAFGGAQGRQLVPRSIPAMEETPVRFATIRRAEGVEPDEAFLHGNGDLVVPASSRAVILLDQSHLTNAFTVLETSGGAGSSVALTYAEALKDADGNKGNRNEIDGKTISGLRDEFTLDGGRERHYQTLWFRTYRYVQVEIETGDEPLRIHDLHGIFVGYPLELNAEFDSDQPWLEDMWEINWRGARLCAWETYVDTPYYEQLQYIGDTRIQALITLYMDGDDLLVRQAIEHFNLSRIPEGITASRYPSDLGQYIPTFSLIWIAMVHDYWMHRDARDYVQGFLPGIRGVLDWFEQHINDSGLPGRIPWWPFVDWATEWQRGIPPGGTEGGSVVIALQYAYALQRAADLEEAFGFDGTALGYRERAQSLLDAVRANAWDSARGLFRDTPGGSTYSQQANVLAVLTDAVPDEEKAGLMQRVLDDSSLTRATYYFSYYLLEALAEAGLGDLYVDQLEPWRGMLALGLTTVPETPEPTRSDSHAWSAHPNYGLLATVLGVRPGEPGFASVRITPHLGSLQKAEGRIPHPKGEIEVRLNRSAAGGVSADINLPPGLPGVLVWDGEEIILAPGQQHLEL